VFWLFRFGQSSWIGLFQCGLGFIWARGGSSSESFIGTAQNKGFGFGLGLCDAVHSRVNDRNSSTFLSCSPLIAGGGGWGIFNALLGWTNSADYGSVISYRIKALALALAFATLFIAGSMTGIAPRFSR
jgi:hypothetical protein